MVYLRLVRVLSVLIGLEQARFIGFSLIVYFATNITGVQRKLNLDRQPSQKGMKPTETSNKLTTNRVPARNSPGKFPI
jgi:hypothetical protein